MRVSGRALVLAVGLSALSAPGVQGYPISPVPLWELVEGSETIVYAEILKITEKPACKSDPEAEECFFESAVATLRILETWKGPAAGEIQVPFPANLMCPAPPRYIKGEEVVAFLSRDRNRWTTVGLSYGTLYPEGRQEWEDLRAMTGRAVSLQRAGKVRPEDRLDWLVEAASRPGTRWHGLYELNPGSDEVHSYYDQQSRKRLTLSGPQIDRIARGFAAHPPMDQTLVMALSLLAGHPDAQVDRALAALMLGVFGETRLPYWIADALQLTLERFGDRKAKQKVAAVRDGCCGIKEAAARNLWRSASKELNVPKVAPLRVSQRKVRGVGAETPD